MKKSYVSPLSDMIGFSAEDILTTSPTSPISVNEKTGDPDALDFNGLDFQ